MSNNTLVFGASGQLGQCLKAVSAKFPHVHIDFPSEQEANILDETALRASFEKYQPQYLINCAAYTAVDKAEDDVETARKINKDGVVLLAKLAKEFGATLIHISTDFVFDGNSSRPLTETDDTNPISVYGLTKLEGEQVIEENTDAYYILRTSWLYSEFANNFVKTMLKLGAERDSLNVIADQIGSPTYAIDLANTIFTIISSEKKEYGIYHYSNEGVTSWYDFAKAIFDLGQVSVKVNPVPTSAYVTRAIRPAYSVMDKTKIKEKFNIEIPYWRDSLAICIKAL